MLQLFLNLLWSNIKIVMLIISITIIIILFVREIISKLDEYILSHLNGQWQNVFIYWHFLGVICHELAHAFFSLLFGFSIDSMKLFQKPTAQNDYKFGFVNTKISFKENEYGHLIWEDFIRGHLDMSLIGFGPIIIILPLSYFLMMQINNNGSLLIKTVCLFFLSSLIWGLELSPIDLKNGFVNLWALLIVAFILTLLWTIVQAIFVF